ncbi:MAG: hypothetical protein R3B47_18260 [Bacteroidia bacterium]
MMKQYLLIISLFVWMLAACGGEEAAGDAASQAGDTTSVVGKREAASQGEVSRDGIEGTWKNTDGTSWIIEGDVIKKIATSGVERSSENFEITEENPCTKETEGPYLVVKGAVMTCYKLLLLDTDSLHLQLSSARPPERFGRQ